MKKSIVVSLFIVLACFVAAMSQVSINGVPNQALSGVSGGASEPCNVTISGDTMTICVGVDNNTPFITGFSGTTVRRVTSQATYQITGAGGGSPTTIKVQLLPAGTISVLASDRTGTCTGCVAIAGSTYTGIPIWEWTVTGTSFDVGGGTKMLAHAGMTPVIGGTDISCTPSGGATICNYTGTAGGSSSTVDMSYWEAHFLPYVNSSTLDFPPTGTYCEASASGIGRDANTVAVAGEPRGHRFFTGGTPADGDWMTCAWGGDAAALSSRPRFPDFVGTFKAFSLGISVRFPTITSVKNRIGIFGSDVDSDPENFVGAILDTAVDSNWRAQICRTGVGCTQSAGTVAASTSLMIVKIEATATGTFTVTINGTPITYSATFPTFSTGTNFATQVRTRTSASRDFEWFETKMKVLR
jgi:hypothetical protein